MNVSYEDEARQDYWRRMEFTSDQWMEIEKHCEAMGLEFMSTACCVVVVELLEKVGIGRYKIGFGRYRKSSAASSYCQDGQTDDAVHRCQ